MTSKPKIFIRDRIYLPVHSIVDTDFLKKKYSIELFKDVACAQCEYKPERPCSVCESCPNYQGVTKLWVPRNIQGDHYIGVPVGDKRNVERKAGILFDEHKIVDARKFVPFDYKIKFLATLRPHQVKLVEDFMRKKYGLLEAPPRTGKTLLMLYIGLQLGQRMVLLANQHEFLQQFIWHIEGNEEEGIPKCTNLPEIQQRVGKKLYGFPRSAEDFETMQLMVMTYQSLMDTCFIKDTHVKLYNGTTKPIQDCDGEFVATRNEKTKKIEWKQATLRHNGKRTDLLAVSYNGTKVVCTPEHLWWSVSRNQYVETRSLYVGEELLDIKDVK